MAAMMDSDSDPSYGSEGGLKEKPIPIKKRGGRKRTKKQHQADRDDSDAESADYSEMTDVADSQAATSGPYLGREVDSDEGPRNGATRGRRPAEQARKKIQLPDDDTDRESVRMPKKAGRDFEEEKMSEKFSEADSTPKINVKPNV